MRTPALILLSLAIISACGESPARRGSSTTEAARDRLIGPWVLSSSLDEFTDELTCLLSVGREESGLVLREKNGIFDVMLVSPESVSASSAVTYRIDDKPAVTADWSASTNHKAMFCDQPESFVVELRHASRLIYRVDLIGGSEFTGKIQFEKTEEAFAAFDECRNYDSASS